ncbi:MAG TPA: fibronectin type III domain-containing protein, partial [Candidatus Eremiobacteraceae bacterium]|nr:fibronectin type III domain-containing protein [Candidatus Eremiobacteraceae bacterium]
MSITRRHQPVARRPTRPCLDLIERRRREQTEERGVEWWPSAPALRTCAASIVGAFALCIVLGLAQIIDPRAFVISEPAMAAQASHQRAAREFHQRTAKRSMIRTTRAMSTHSKRAASGRRAARDPVAQPSPVASAAGSVPAAAPSAPQPASPLVVVQPWHLTADGTWSATVSYPLDPGVDPLTADVVFSSDTADVLPLDLHAAHAPGAIVTVDDGSKPVDIEAVARQPALGPESIELPAPQVDPETFESAAQDIGPHLIDVGWTQLPDGQDVSEYKIYRRAAGEPRGVLVASVSPAGRTYRDDSVRPTTAYTYTVVADTAQGDPRASTGFVATPPIMPPTSLSAISGKGMFLYFSPSRIEANSFTRYDPEAVVARARAAGISHIELRM